MPVPIIKGVVKDILIPPIIMSSNMVLAKVPIITMMIKPKYKALLLIVTEALSTVKHIKKIEYLLKSLAKLNTRIAQN